MSTAGDIAPQCANIVPSHDYDVLFWFGDKVAGPLLAGLLLAVVGSWILARKNERYRGRRDHITKSVDALRSQIEELIDVSCGYWSRKAGSGDCAVEAEIEYRLSDISTLTRICAAELWSKQEAKGPLLVTKLLLAVVSQDFGVKGRKPDPARIRLILKATQELSEAVATSRQRYFSDRDNLFNKIFG